MTTRRRATGVNGNTDKHNVVQADPETLAVFARELLDGEDDLRRRVVELEQSLVQFHRALPASGSRVRLPNPLPEVLACLDDRVMLSTQISRLAGTFDQLDDLDVRDLEP